MAGVGEPILSRLDRLDSILRQLEEIRGGNRSARSSYASTPSSGTQMSGGAASSVDFSPRSLVGKHCRPMDDVMMETEVKGTIVERLRLVEDRVIKLHLQLEEELEDAKRREEKAEKKSQKKGLKKLVKSFVKGKGKHKVKD